MFWNNNLDVILLKPDKYNATVVMYQSDYNKKITNLLNYKIIYKLLKTNPTNIFQTKNNKIIIHLFENNM